MRYNEFTLETTATNVINRLLSKTATTYANGIAGGVSTTQIRRAGSLLLQGRSQEADVLIRSALRTADPVKRQQVLDWAKTVKPPVPDATGAKLDAMPQVADWLDNQFVPYITQHLTPMADKTASSTVAKTAADATVVSLDKFKNSGLSFVNMPTKIVKNNQAVSVLSPVVNYEGRGIVIVQVKGSPMMFYCSSGENPKLGVFPGKWYPVFGIGPDGWINKGTSKGIGQYYNVPALRTVCLQLDAKIGDIRADLTDITRYGRAKADAIDVINQGRNPVAHSDGYEAFEANAMAQLKPFL